MSSWSIRKKGSCGEGYMGRGEAAGEAWRRGKMRERARWLHGRHAHTMFCIHKLQHAPKMALSAPIWTNRCGDSHAAVCRNIRTPPPTWSAACFFMRFKELRAQTSKEFISPKWGDWFRLILHRCDTNLWYFHLHLLSGTDPVFNTPPWRAQCCLEKGWRHHTIKSRQEIIRASLDIFDQVGLKNFQHFSQKECWTARTWNQGPKQSYRFLSI